MLSTYDLNSNKATYKTGAQVSQFLLAAEHYEEWRYSGQGWTQKQTDQRAGIQDQDKPNR